MPTSVPIPKGKERLHADAILVSRAARGLLGDRLEDVFERIGADRFAKAYEALTGLPCGCGGRRDFINSVDRLVRHLLGRD